MLKNDNLNDPQFRAIVQKAHSSSEEFAEILAEAALRLMDGPDRAPQAIVLQMVAMSGPMAMVAKLTAANGSRLNGDHILFAAILAALCTPQTREGVSLEWSPQKMVDAMDMYERATGQKPDKMLFVPMVKAMREFQAEGAESANSMLADALARK